MHQFDPGTTWSVSVIAEAEIAMLPRRRGRPVRRGEAVEARRTLHPRLQPQHRQCPEMR